MLKFILILTSNNSIMFIRFEFQQSHGRRRRDIQILASYTALDWRSKPDEKN